MSVEATVDADDCIGSGMCVAIAPEIFELDDGDVAVIVSETEGPELQEALRNAAACCPVDAIKLTEDG